MVILDEWIKSCLTITRTDSEHRQFAREGHESLEDVRNLRQLQLGFRDVFRGAENPLAFAVITHAASLEHSGEAKLPGCHI